jgi:hypothetical protein
MLYVKADDESILSYGEEVQRWQTVFMPLDLSTVVLGIGIMLKFENMQKTRHHLSDTVSENSYEITS